MKFQNILLFFFSIMFLVLLISVVSAFDVNYPVYSATIENNLSLNQTLIPVNGLGAIGYKCLNSACTDINASEPVSGMSILVINNLVHVVFPTTQTPHGYILYFYKSGYIGWAQKDNAWGSGSATGVNIYLSKKRNAGADIFNFLVDTNSGVTSATIDSAIKTTAFATIPLLEKIATTVNFKINNTQTGQVLNMQSQNLLIPYSLTQNVNFTYNFSQLAPGNYTVTLFSDVLNEDKIINSITYSQSQQITIFNNSGNNETNNTLTVPLINIIHPINTIYNISDLRLDVNATQMITNWTFNLNNHGNKSFIPNVSILVDEGNNHLIVYGINANGTGIASVYFFVNTTGINDTNNSSLAGLTIISPQSGIYNSKVLLVNLSASNYSSIWFNWNGTDQNYSSPVLVDFLINGTYTLFAYANNSLGNITARNVTFQINTSMNSTLVWLISNITTNPTLPFINNGSSTNVSVNFTSNMYPMNLTFNLYNSSSLVNTQGPFVLINNNSLPINYVIPNNLSNGIYFLNMTIVNNLGDSKTFYLGNFTVLRIINNTNQTDDDDDNDNHRDNNFTYYNNQVVNLRNLDSENFSNSVNGTLVLSTKKNSFAFDFFNKKFLYWLIIGILVLLILVILAVMARMR